MGIWDGVIGGGFPLPDQGRGQALRECQMEYVGEGVCDTPLRDLSNGYSPLWGDVKGMDLEFWQE